MTTFLVLSFLKVSCLDVKDHNLEVDSWLSFVVSTVSLSLSHWYPVQGWYLNVSIPDLIFAPLLTLIHESNSTHTVSYSIP